MEKIQLKKMLFIASLLWATQIPAQYQARLNFNAKYEPSDKILHGAGQSDEIDFNTYCANMDEDVYPTIYTFYTRVNRTVSDQENKVSTNLDIVNRHPGDVIPHISINWTSGGVAYPSEVLNGDHDASILKIAELLDDYGGPVLARIGYEANGFWNGYSPTSYKQVFIYIRNLLVTNAPNVATVWCVHPEDSLATKMSYYPGDQYVDWWGIDIFEPSDTNSTATEAFLDEAVIYEKPVFIAETGPATVGSDNGTTSWNNWFDPFFDMLRNNPVIKGFSYINNNWYSSSSLPQWLDWRIYQDSYVLETYKAELQNTIFQYANVPTDFDISAPIASNDVYVRGGTYSGTNYNGSDPERMLLRSSSVANQVREGHFTFELNGAANIQQAILSFYVRNPNTQNVSFNLYGSDDASWDEDNLVWNDRPSSSGQLGSFTIDGDDDEWFEVDVTNFVQGEEGKANVGFILRAVTQDLNLEVDTKDYTQGNYPTLSIFHDGFLDDGFLDDGFLDDGNYTVSKSSDDAEEEGNGSMDLTSSDLDMGLRTNAVRFDNVDVPEGATIVEAYVQFTSDSNNRTDYSELELYGEAIGDSPTFTSAQDNISLRNLTTATVDWVVPSWSTGGLSGTDQRTPDLSNIIQEITDNAGWTSGNALSIIIEGASGQRDAVSYDGNPSDAPILFVDYIIEENISVSKSSGDAEEEGNGSMDLTSSDLDMGLRINAVRFDNVDVPEGATIVEAYVQFTSDSNNRTDYSELELYGEAIGDSPTFTSAQDNISLRNLTTATVDWVVPSWSTGGLSGTDQRTPDLSNIIQEITDNAGWTSGNALSIIIEGASGQRDAVSYDGNSSDAPKLVVKYKEGPGGMVTLKALLPPSGIPQKMETPNGQNTDLDVLIFPNPSRESATLTNILPESTIEVFDFQGRRLQVYKNVREKNFTLENFKRGLYIIVVRKNGKTYHTVKMSVQ